MCLIIGIIISHDVLLIGMPYQITSRIVFHFYLPRFPLETIALIYLDDSSARHSSNTLRDDVEDRLKNAHVAGDEEA